MAIPLEDNVGDIIGKAQRGLRIAESELAKRAGLAGEQTRELRAGTGTATSFTTKPSRRARTFQESRFDG